MMLIDEIKVMGEFHNDMKYVPEKDVIMEHSHHYTDSIRKTAKEVLTSVPLPYLKNWWETTIYDLMVSEYGTGTKFQRNANST